MKKGFILTAIVMMAIVTALSSCSKKQELTLGTYISDGEYSSKLILQSNNGFTLFADETVDYHPTGQYSIKGNKLVLTEGDVEHVFLIDGDKLTFESGDWLGNWIENGTAFQLSDDEIALSLGSYHIADDERLIYVTLSEDNEFALGNGYSSHCPMGHYAIDGNKLILSEIDSSTFEDVGEYIFLITDDKLVFESGAWLENDIDKGAIFQLSNEEAED